MTTDGQNSFGALLRRYRKQAGLTQEELAEQAELSVRQLSYLEGGKYAPYPRTVRRLADALILSEQDRSRFSIAAQARQDGSGRDREWQLSSLPSLRHHVLPSTEVRTFLIADVRDYTALTEQQGNERAAELTARFARLVREVVSSWGGEVIELRGDEALALFPSARRALQGALKLQARVQQEREVDPTLPLPVGIGLDAGDVVPVEGGYRGGALNRAARLCSLARAGEIFVTDTMIALAGSIEGVTYLDRGEAGLKGLAEPVHIVQVAAEGAVQTDLPRFTVHTTARTNLPVQPTAFIGREREIVAVADNLRQEEVRLLTLTGPGGTGKTRLAIQVAHDLLDTFPDGVYFVSLAPLTDPTLVPSAIATALEIREEGGQPLLETVKTTLREKRQLLILDNFEHLPEAAPVVAEILAACPELKVLVTSRSVLHLAAEHDYAVPPLAVPEHKQSHTLGALVQYAAVALFVRQARATKSSFALSLENAEAVVEICRQLDGLPLAIVLAAANVRLFPPQALLRRLERRLPLLTGGARDLPARQQTLRAAIEWSYDLLDAGQKRLFARLSVFVGGCSLEASKAVCDPDGDLEVGVLDGLASLLEQSLVQQEGEDEPRFVVLETIREYARERLEESGESARIRQQHADYYLGLAEESEEQLHGPEPGAWFERLETEHQNLRAALAWSVEAQQTELTVRLASALTYFWVLRQHLDEGRKWLEIAVTLPTVDRARRAQILYGLGSVNRFAGDHKAAEKLLEESVALQRELGEPLPLANSLQVLGLVFLEQGDPERTRALWEEALALARLAGSPLRAAQQLGALGNLARHKGELERAHTLLTESVRLQREAGQPPPLPWFLAILAQVERERGDYAGAQRHAEEALRISRRWKYPREEVAALWGLAETAIAQGHLDEALHRLEETLGLVRQRGDTRHENLPETLRMLGIVLTKQGDLARAQESFSEGLRASRRIGALSVVGHLEGLAAVSRDAARAARLFAAAEALRERIGIPAPPIERAFADEAMLATRGQLDEAVWQAAWDEGRSMTIDQAVEYALDEDTPSRT